MMKNIAIALLSCTLFVEAAAQTPGADECNRYVQSIYDRTEREDAAQPDILIYIVTNARLGRDCYGTRRPDRLVWLLNNEVLALDLLGRYDEAAALVDLFFDTYFDGASDLFRGKMYQWRLQYFVYEGLYEDAAIAYDSAQQYDRALTLAQRAVLRNDGAVLAIRREDFEEATRLTMEGIALLDSTYHLRDEGVILARLLHKRAEAILARYSDDSTFVRLEPAASDLAAAIALRDSLGFTERQAEAFVTLGEIYHALGDGPAGRGSMGRGLALARDGGNARGEIFALWRIGRLSRRSGAPSLAHEQLQMALDQSQESGVGEFKLFIELELGRLFEDGEAWRRAEGFYRAVVETPDEARYRSSLYDEAKARDEAEQRSITMRLYIAETQSARYRLGLFGAGLVILALIVFGAWIWWRKPWAAQGVSLLEASVLEVQVPEASMQEVPAPVLLVRFPYPTGNDKLDNRLEHLREILQRESPKDNTTLYLLLNDEITAPLTGDDPAGSYRKYFKRKCRELGVVYPEEPIEWRRALGLAA